MEFLTNSLYSSSSKLKIQFIFSANSLLFPLSNIAPLTLSSIFSCIAPILLPITGVPNANDSVTVNPKASCHIDGNTVHLAFAISLCKSCPDLNPNKLTFLILFSFINVFTISSSGPIPTIFTFISDLIYFKASINTNKPFSFDNLP